MAFAENRQAFGNRNFSCIHCGICIDLRPIDRLRFDVKRTDFAALPVCGTRR